MHCPPDTERACPDTEVHGPLSLRPRPSAQQVLFAVCSCILILISMHYDAVFVRFVPAYGATFSGGWPIPGTSAFGGRRSGFGPRCKAQCRTRVVSCAFASQVRRSRA